MTDNYSLVTADRTTHYKIVAVSLIAAIVVVVVGVTARVADTGTATARVETSKSVVKAGKPATISSHEAPTIR